MKTKLSKKFWLTLVIFSLVGQVAWVVENMYFNVFVYKMFHASAGQISLMVGASAVAATVTTLLIGALSDHVGKRKVFICTGYILWGLSILLFAGIRMDVIQNIIPDTVKAASLGVSLVIALDCIMTFFGSSANDACFNAWLTDCGDETNRGSIEGVNSMMPLVAILVVFGGFMSFDLEQAGSWSLIFFLIGGIVIVIGGLGFTLIDEKKLIDNGILTPDRSTSYFKNIFYGFKPVVVKQHQMLYITLAAFAIFGISIQTFMPYLILYYEKSLNLSDYVLIMAPAIIIAAIITVFYGKLYDRIGFVRALIPSMLCLIFGYALLYLSQVTTAVFAGSLCMMTGYLTGMAVFGAMIRSYTPKDKVGLFQGLRIFGQVFIPGIAGPALGAYVLRNADTIINGDGTSSFIPNQDIFLAAMVVVLPVFVLATVIRHKEES